MSLTISDGTIRDMISALNDKLNLARGYECGQTFLRWRDEGFLGLTQDQQERVIKAMNDHGLI